MTNTTPTTPVQRPAPAPRQTAVKDAARSERPAHQVDPYDMRPEPQIEEPGYGHGV